MAVDREHVNVTKKHSVPFAFVKRDLKVTAAFVHCLCVSRLVNG